MPVESPWSSLKPYTPQTLPQFLEESVKRSWDRPALITIDDTTYTFGQVWEAGQSLGRYLQDQGIGKGERIAILSANSPEYVVAFLGIVQAGAVVTTLNPLYKERELQHQLEDSGASAIFALKFLETPVKKLADEIPALKRVWAVEDVWSMAKEAPTAVSPVEIDPAVDLAALPYSSGTTGLPKGVMLTHSNIVANVRQIIHTGIVNPDTVILGFLPFFHIYGLTVLVNGGLATGCTHVVMPRFDAQQCLELVQRYRVTSLPVVPPALHALTNLPNVDDFDTSSLQYIASGAAPLPAEVAQKAAKALGCLVLQGYGMTETSAVSNLTPLDRPKLNAVGPPVSDTLEKIVSLEDDSEVAPGEEGELLISGPQIMRGYWNRPDETAETLTEDGWLRTGDIARVDEDSYVYVVDRRKELIKYKGFQVAPAELEALLLEHPAILDAAVIPKPDPASGEIPKAFVQLRPGQEASDTEIAEFVAERVAPHKKLREVEFVDAIPKSLSGKILRRELIDRERSAAAG